MVARVNPLMLNPLMKMATLLALAVSLMMTGLAPVAARGEIPGRFDHYVLSMSWSPTYCAGAGRDRDDLQCRSDRPYAFIAHGLWPQYEQGWPEFCSTRDRWVEKDTINSMLDIMPSKGLIIHEWRRHGTCSGLSQDDYFDMVRTLFSEISIPAKYQAPEQDIVTTTDALRSELLAANPKLEPSMIKIYCGTRKDRGQLSEVRICHSKKGEPIACDSSDHRRQCRTQSLVIPAARAR